MKKAKAGLSCSEKKILNQIWKQRIRSPERRRKIRHRVSASGILSWNICRMSRILWNFFRGHLFRQSMKFSVFFMFRWKVWERSRLRESPIIQSRNAIPTWIWRQQGNQGSTGCTITPIWSCVEKVLRWQWSIRGLIIRMKCFEMQAAPESLIYGISP